MKTRYNLSSADDINHALVVSKIALKPGERKKLVIDNVRYTYTHHGYEKRIRSEVPPGLYAGRTLLDTFFTGLFTAARLRPQNTAINTDIVVPLPNPPGADVPTVIDTLKVLKAPPNKFLQITRGNRHWKKLWWFGASGKYAPHYDADPIAWVAVDNFNPKVTWAGGYTHSAPAQLGNEVTFGFGFVPLDKTLWMNRAKLPIPTALFTEPTKNGLFNGDNDAPTYPRVGEGIVAACYVDGVPNPDNDNIPERQYRVIVQITTIPNNTPAESSATTSFKYAKFFLGKDSPVTFVTLSNGGSPFTLVTQQFIFNLAGNKAIVILDAAVWELTLNASGSVTSFNILRNRSIPHTDAVSTDTVLAADYDKNNALVYIRGISRIEIDNTELTSQHSAPNTATWWVEGWSSPGFSPPGYGWFNHWIANAPMNDTRNVKYFDISSISDENGTNYIIHSGPTTIYRTHTQTRIQEYDSEVFYNNTSVVPAQAFRYDFSTRYREDLLQVKIIATGSTAQGIYGAQVPEYENSTLTGGHNNLGNGTVTGDIAEGRVFISSGLLADPQTTWPPGSAAKYTFNTNKLQVRVVDDGVRVRTEEVATTIFHPDMGVNQLAPVFAAAALKPDGKRAFFSAYFKNPLSGYKAVTMYFYTPTSTQDDWRVSQQFLTDPNTLYTGPVYF